MDGVDMATRLTGRDDRVYATVEDWYSTWQPPKCVSSGNKEDPCSENRQNHHEVVTKSAESAESERQRGIRLWDAGNRLTLRVFIMCLQIIVVPAISNSS